LALIDIGPGVTSEASNIAAGSTLVDKANPANDTGTIDHLEVRIFSSPSPGTVDMATFFVVSGDNLSTRASADDLPIPAGSSNTVYEFDAPGDFSAFDVELGDYLGIFLNGVALNSAATGGAGIWFVLAADHIPCTNQAFSVAAGFKISVLGTGVTSGGGGGDGPISVGASKRRLLMGVGL
jgi:hypothetical protein